MATTTKPKRRKVSAASKAKAKAHLDKLEKDWPSKKKGVSKQEQTRRKKNVLRTQVRMGDRKTRREAASKLSNMPRAGTKKTK